LAVDIELAVVFVNMAAARIEIALAVVEAVVNIEAVLLAVYTETAFVVGLDYSKLKDSDCSKNPDHSALEDSDCSTPGHPVLEHPDCSTLGHPDSMLRNFGCSLWNPDYPTSRNLDYASLRNLHHLLNHPNLYRNES